MASQAGSKTSAPRGAAVPTVSRRRRGNICKGTTTRQRHSATWCVLRTHHSVYQSVCAIVHELEQAGHVYMHSIRRRSVAVQSPHDAATIATVQLLLARVTALESGQRVQGSTQDVEASDRLRVLEQRMREATSMLAELQTTQAAATQRTCAEPASGALMDRSLALSTLHSLGMDADLAVRLPEMAATADSTDKKVEELRREVQQLSDTSQRLQAVVLQLQHSTDARDVAESDADKGSFAVQSAAATAEAAAADKAAGVQRMLEDCQSQSHQQSCLIGEQGLIVSELQDSMQATQQQMAQMQRAREGEQEQARHAAENGALACDVRALTKQVQDMQARLDVALPERERDFVAETQQRSSRDRAYSGDLGSPSDVNISPTGAAGEVRPSSHA